MRRIFLLSALCGLGVSSLPAQDIFVPRELKAKPALDANGRDRIAAPRPHVPMAKPTPYKVRATPVLREPATRTAAEWKPYLGAQVREVNMEPDTRVLHNYAVPVLLGAPSREYDVLGSIYVWKADPQSRNPQIDAIKAAASTAKLHGAEAMAVWRRRKDYNWYMGATAIRWRSRAGRDETPFSQEARKLRDQFRKGP